MAKYLIITNVDDFTTSTKRTAKTWLKELRKQNKRYTDVDVCDNEGWWLTCATIDENGDVIDGFYCPDGEPRIWIQWACEQFPIDTHCKSFCDAYYSINEVNDGYEARHKQWKLEHWGWC